MMTQSLPVGVVFGGPNAEYYPCRVLYVRDGAENSLDLGLFVVTLILADFVIDDEVKLSPFLSHDMVKPVPSLNTIQAFRVKSSSSRYAKLPSNS